MLPLFYKNRQQGEFQWIQEQFVEGLELETWRFWIIPCACNPSIDFTDVSYIIWIYTPTFNYQPIKVILRNKHKTISKGKSFLKMNLIRSKVCRMLVFIIKVDWCRVEQTQPHSHFQQNLRFFYLFVIYTIEVLY